MKPPTAVVLLKPLKLLSNFGICWCVGWPLEGFLEARRLPWDLKSQITGAPKFRRYFSPPLSYEASNSYMGFLVTDVSWPGLLHAKNTLGFVWTVSQTTRTKHTLPAFGCWSWLQAGDVKETTAYRNHTGQHVGTCNPYLELLCINTHIHTPSYFWQLPPWIVIYFFFSSLFCKQVSSCRCLGRPHFYVNLA